MTEYAMGLKDAPSRSCARPGHPAATRGSRSLKRHLARRPGSQPGTDRHVQSRADEVEAAITNARQAVAIWESLAENNSASADIRAGSPHAIAIWETILD